MKNKLARRQFIVLAGGGLAILLGILVMAWNTRWGTILGTGLLTGGMAAFLAVALRWTPRKKVKAPKRHVSAKTGQSTRGFSAEEKSLLLKYTSATEYRTRSRALELKSLADKDDLRSVQTRIEGLHAEISRIADSLTKADPGSPGKTKPMQTAATSTAPKSSNAPTSAANTYEFPPVPYPTSGPVFKNVTAAVVADEFTAAAFSYEWNTFEPTPENWRSEIDTRKPSFLFVESAWEANGGSWRYHLVGMTAPRPALVEMVEYCREKGIPSVFWNKEDPPHFEEFLPTAALFDFVYTTDSNLLAEYKRRLGHDRVEVLPFAAQPKIHNPARIGRVMRTRDIVFGGMFFRDKYPERRRQLETILPAAAAHNLDIYARQDGKDIKYRFPEAYRSFIRPSIPYPQMITAYHAYKAVISVNSVVSSDTMCARRIFEATACGAAVVTESSPAIAHFFPNNMLTEVQNQEDASYKIRSLIRSAEYRDRKTHVAQRHVLENHTYTDRAQTILRRVGLEADLEPQRVSFFVSSNRPSNLSTTFENVGRQNVAEKELVFLAHGFTPDSAEIDRLSLLHGLERVTVLEAPVQDSLGKNLNRLTAACTGDVLFRMDDDDYYGPNYARDLKTALHFSGAALAGKAASYIYFEDLNSTILTYELHEHRFTDFVRGATFCGPKSTFIEQQFPELATSEDSAFIKQILANNKKIYAGDRFNFIVKRHADKNRHTWQVSDEKLFSSGTVKFRGDDPEQVDV